MDPFEAFGSARCAFCGASPFTPAVMTPFPRHQATLEGQSMDRRTLLAVGLCLAIYYTWFGLRQATAPEGDTDSLVSEVQPAPAPVVAPVIPVPELPDTPTETRDVTWCATDGFVTTDGGLARGLNFVNETAPYEVTPIYSWLFGLVTGSSEGSFSPYGPEPGPAQVLTEDAQAFSLGVGDATDPQYQLADAGELTLTGQIGDVVVSKRIHAGGTPCEVSVEVSWENRGTVASGPIWMGMHDVFSEGGGGGMFAGYSNQRGLAAQVDGSAETYLAFDGLDEEADPREGPVDWFGIGDRYHGLLLVPEDGTSAELVFTSEPGTEEHRAYGMRYVAAPSLAAGEARTERFRGYVGTLDTALLADFDPKLSGAVQYGWFSLFARPLLYLLKLFYSAVGNWGLAIVMLTFTIKLVFFPLTQTAFKSSQAMSALQPKMKEVREKFAEKPEELNKATMALFKEHGVNPLGGCLPMVLQMPVWFALYRVLLNSVELYHTEFIYLRDLSSPDPYGVLPALAVALMLLQQQFMPTGNMDPAQARMMKLMPLMFGAFFFIMPAGLCVYIFVNMSLSILQQWVIRKTYKGPVPEVVAPQGA
jgi:YidC/Oxa1 family membrane protein insertase